MRSEMSPFRSTVVLISAHCARASAVLRSDISLPSRHTTLDHQCGGSSNAYWEAILQCSVLFSSVQFSSGKPFFSSGYHFYVWCELPTATSTHWFHKPRWIVWFYCGFPLSIFILQEPNQQIDFKYKLRYIIPVNTKEVLSYTNLQELSYKSGRQLWES
ncbi:hypothetical protein EVAR_69374_1 [Eumeta japonica]|uniref:Uncharacterized protein n=1 Tax=Eumeta variegata TaxID=151549 RepID=A0A4C1ZV01_EUMVA|nr:hypothetical protein EVAR_69374_1 [Eumeta japonica]